MPLNIMTFIITTLSIMCSFATLSINDTRHIWHSAWSKFLYAACWYGECCYSECRNAECRYVMAPIYTLLRLTSLVSPIKLNSNAIIMYSHIYSIILIRWYPFRVIRQNANYGQQMDGRADGRTGGWADGRTGGRADGRTGGRADEWPDGLKDS